jgi:hypothetical protein
MAEQSKLPNALKHGAYCKSALLPGESAVELKRLHLALIDELNPLGALEQHIVATLARLVWRKQNLATYEVAAYAREYLAEIRSSADPMTIFAPGDKRTLEQILEARKAAEKTAREELSDHWELIEIGQIATTDYLLKELAVVDRLDGLIDKCVKQLLMVRGVKSMTIHPSNAKALTAPAAGRSR